MYEVWKLSFLTPVIIRSYDMKCKSDMQIV